MALSTQSAMGKHLADDTALSAARAEMGTTTIMETANWSSPRPPPIRSASNSRSQLRTQGPTPIGPSPVESEEPANPGPSPTLGIQAEPVQPIGGGRWSFRGLTAEVPVATRLSRSCHTFRSSSRGVH